MACATAGNNGYRGQATAIDDGPNSIHPVRAAGAVAHRVVIGVNAELAIAGQRDIKQEKRQSMR